MLLRKNSPSDLPKGMFLIFLLIALFFISSCSNQEDGAPDIIEGAGEQVKEKDLKSSEEEFPYKEENGSKIYFKTEKLPAFKGNGIMGFREYIQQQIEYPEEAKKEGLEDQVFVKFVINEEGKNTEVEVMRGKHEKLNQAVVEAIKNAPAWEPARHNGEKVKIQLTIPVTFKMKK
jgi:TonB family protein